MLFWKGYKLKNLARQCLDIFKNLNLQGKLFVMVQIKAVIEKQLNKALMISTEHFFQSALRRDFRYEIYELELPLKHLK